MYLKRIEMLGFKSFADKTRLNFEPGITGIVGPNGCGKSNVIDAIRWCLGEQGAKSLRSHQMLDVIFNGTQKKAPLGMAEVTLTFDNSQNVLPVDYSEVTVSRRIFRSGESEYYLNKTQTRLKDIRDLFLDTGIGTEGYSVMEQGRVEFILSSRPEERRSLFEEAAGVSKYKARREEALRKLEKINFDLLRLNDSLAMLKDQLKGLDAQARKARNYQNLKEELKKLEITEMVGEFKKNESQMEGMEKDFEESRNKLERLVAEVDGMEAGIEQQRFKLQEKDEQYVKVQGESMKMHAEVESLEHRVAQAKKAQEDLEIKIQTLNEEISRDTRDIEELMGKRSVIEQELGSLKVEFDIVQGRMTEIEGQHTVVVSELAEKIEHKDGLSGKFRESSESLVSVNNDLAHLKSLKAHNEAELNSRFREMQKLDEKYNPQVQGLDGLKSRYNEDSDIVKQFESVVAELTQKVKDIQSVIDGLKNEISELEKEKSATEAKIETFVELQKSDPYIAGTKAVISRNFEGIYGPVYRLIDSDQKGEKILSHYLGDKLNYLVADTAGRAFEATNYLRENNLGRANFIILENLPEIQVSVTEPVAERPLLELTGCEERFKGLINFLLGRAYHNDDTILSDVFVQGGSKVEEVLSYFNRMKDSDLLEKRLRELVSFIEAKQQNLCESVKHLEATVGEMELKRREFEQRKLEFSVLEQQMSSTEQEVQLMIQEKTVISNEMEHVKSEGNKINEDLDNHIRSQEMILQMVNSLNVEIAQCSEQVSGLRSKEKEVNDVLTNVKVEHGSMAERIQAKEKEKEYMDTQLENFVNFRERRKEELTLSIADKEGQAKLDEESTVRIREIFLELESVEKEVALHKDERNRISEAIRLEGEKLHAMKAELSGLQENVHRLELKLSHNRDEQRSIEKSLQQNYSIELNEALEKYEVREVTTEEKTKIKRRIEAIGAVNLAAPEEYAELTQRHDFLQGQMDDIVKAREDLMQVINKINSVTKTNFKETFEKVRENFKIVFGKLFEGGEADIVLTNEANLLETGVDIIAQPPGKKLSNIMALSGGEKALTAIAFLFAFYMVRPSPFCILDEVDAPLDDANIGRFISIVKGFTQQSQFLMITHNRRTMEMADALYGVTMEEFGVSKFISVKMAHEEKDEPSVEEHTSVDEKDEGLVPA